MTPQEAARELEEELQEALADLDGRDLHSVTVQPPGDLGAEGHFRVAVERPDRGTVTRPLPTTLAMGYLADAESAVDEWKHWVRDLHAQLG